MNERRKLSDLPTERLRKILRDTITFAGIDCKSAEILRREIANREASDSADDSRGKS